MRSVFRRVLLFLIIGLCGHQVSPAGDVQGISAAVLNESLNQSSVHSVLEISGGDINMDAIPFTIADGVMFLNYFVYGLSGLPPSPLLEGSIAQSDVNGDGLTLTLADWVMLYRVIVGDTAPLPLQPKYIPELAPIHFAYDTVSGTMSLIAPENAALAVFRVPGGSTVTPLGSLPAGMALDAVEAGGATVITLTPNDYVTIPFIPIGPLFQIDQGPTINSVIAADWSGETAVTLTYGTAPCCLGQTGDISGDGSRNLTDLTLLVNHLFVTFAPLTCPAAANTSGDTGCGVSLTDVTALVNFLFVSFEPVAGCIAACE